MPQCIRTLLGLDQFMNSALLCSSVVPSVTVRGVVGWERVGMAFAHLFWCMERVPKPFCTRLL